MTSKALNTCRNDPVLIQAHSEDKGRGYQSGAAELSLGARLRSLCAHKAPAPGDPRGAEAAAEESRRWGRAPAAGGLSSPARPAAPVHALPPPRTDVLSSMEGSGSSGVWALPSEGFLQAKEQISLLIIQWGLRAQRPRVPLRHLLLKLRAAAAPRAAARLLLSPRCNVSAFQHHQCWENTAPWKEKGEKLHTIQPVIGLQLKDSVGRCALRTSGASVSYTNAELWQIKNATVAIVPFSNESISTRVKNPHTARG